MLDKRLELGGLQVGGPRTSQNPARFRVANNVYQTRDNQYVRRSHGEVVADSSKFTNAQKLVGSTRYKNEPFVLGINSSNQYEFYKISGSTVSRLPKSSNLPSPTILGGSLSASAPQYLENVGCLFMLLNGSNLIKNDGTQVYRAGVPLPYFSCAERSDAGATYVRVIQHHLDFQGNNVYSGYVEFRATPTAGGQITLRVDKGATDILTQNLTGVSPENRSTWEKFDGSFDEFYLRGSSTTVNALANEVVVTTGGNHNVSEGAYLLISAQYQPPVTTGFTFYTYAVALKVKSSNATSVTLDLTNAKYLDINREWQTANLPTTSLLLVSIPDAVNYWLSIWTSNVATGAYVWKGVCPAQYNSSATENFTFTVSTPTSPAAGSDSFAFLISPILGDFYDVTSLKGQFEWDRNGKDGAMACYADNLLLTDPSRTIIFYSDPTLGGSFEMTTGASSVFIGEGNDGYIQTICGNASNFLLVSRQYKNYFVSGRLETGNYQVKALDKTSLGAYSNEASLAVDGKIFFLNKQGIWAVYTGGRCDEISFPIQGFFDTYSTANSFPEESYFNLDAYPTYAHEETSVSDQWIRVKMDTQRNMIFFFIKGETGEGRSLALNLNNGEFYTWSGLINNYLTTGTYDFKDIVFINGEYYALANRGTTFALIKEKKKNFSVLYSGIHKPKLVRTWFTAGEPSLEKKLQQLKMFGLCTTPVKVIHSLDWAAAEIEDGNYTNTQPELFSHKKRLTPANFQSVSVGIEFDYDANLFQIEGIEIEFQPFQEGMKR